MPPIQQLNTFGDIATKVVLALFNGSNAVLLFLFSAALCSGCRSSGMTAVRRRHCEFYPAATL